MPPRRMAQLHQQWSTRSRRGRWRCSLPLRLRSPLLRAAAVAPAAATVDAATARVPAAVRATEAAVKVRAAEARADATAREGLEA